MNNQITYADKVALNQNATVPDINKVNASDMNEIKSVVNGTINGSLPMGNILVDGVNYKNIINLLDYTATDDGITVSCSNNVITVSGTATGAGIIDIPMVNDIEASIGSITKSFSKSGTYEHIKTSLRDSSGAIIGLYSDNLENKTDTLTGTAHLFRIQVDSGYTVNATFQVMIEKGNTATSFAPPKNLGYVSGSNANGRYIKYDDGTLIQWGTIDKTNFLNSGSSFYETVQGIKWYRSGPYQLYFPVPFVLNSYAIEITPNTGLIGTRMAIPRTYENYASNTVIQLVGVEDFISSAVGYTNLVNVSWVAIGRWK